MRYFSQSPKTVFGACLHSPKLSKKNYRLCVIGISQRNKIGLVQKSTRDIHSWYDSANMRPIRTSSPFLLSGLVLSFMIITKVSAQMCPQNPNIDIAFPEHDPTGSATPGGSDPQFRQQLPIPGEPYRVLIGPDTSKSNSFPFDEYFTYGYNVVLGSYYVVMTKGIDRDGNTATVDDDTNILQYQLVCKETASSPEMYAILKIQITDVNDNIPQFQNAPYNLSVNELTPIGMTVFRQISAIDRDEGANRQIEYSLSDSPGAQFAGSSYFSLSSIADGFVSVAQFLDFESMYEATNCDPVEVYYNITITAKDSGNPRLSSTTTMIIHILDGDDLGPGFVYPSCVPNPEQCDNSCKGPKYRSSIPSGTNEDTALVFTPEPVDASNPSGTVDIVMQDRDTLNAAVNCDVAFTIPAGYESYFRAASTPLSGKQYKCEVTYTVPSGQQPLNRNSLPELELVIEATEQTSNRRQDFASIVIILTETTSTSSSNSSCECGQLAITASSSTGYIYENSPARTLVAGDPVISKALQLTFTGPSVSPSDPSSGFDISWSEGTPFAVNSYGFVYLATATLDYETTHLYLLTVTITERTPERRTATTDLTINVLDVVCND